MAETAARTVSCRGCKHYRISWDPKAPHACAAMGFKSQKLPSIVVYETSGIECQMFQAKPADGPKLFGSLRGGPRLAPPRIGAKNAGRVKS